MEKVGSLAMQAALRTIAPLTAQFMALLIERSSTTPAAIS